MSASIVYKLHLTGDVLRLEMIRAFGLTQRNNTTCAPIKVTSQKSTRMVAEHMHEVNKTRRRGHAGCGFQCKGPQYLCVGSKERKGGPRGRKCGMRLIRRGEPKATCSRK